MKRIVSALFVSAAMLLAAPAIQAAPILFVTDLSGPAESPPNASPGTGFASVLIDDVTHQMVVHIVFSDLAGLTTASHIHCCTAVPGAGNVMVATVLPNFTGFPLGVVSGTYDHTFDTSLASTWNAAFVAGMLGDMAYLNIHSQIFPGGEIRGFLQVPEPATLALLCCGLLMLGFAQRRRLG
jgi:hypothetical protein